MVFKKGGASIKNENNRHEILFDEVYSNIYFILKRHIFLKSVTLKSGEDKSFFVSENKYPCLKAWWMDQYGLTTTTTCAKENKVYFFKTCFFNKFYIPS